MLKIVKETCLSVLIRGDGLSATANHVSNVYLKIVFASDYLP